MMATRAPLEIGEWYHCYTRGVDKRTVFEKAEDYDRFLVHLHVSNSDKNIRASDLKDARLHSVLLNPPLRGEPLAEIGAYALMPNHIHLLMREIRKGGIGDFMQKVFTGYTKYFNNKYDRAGALFASTFKSKHIIDDRYLKQVVPYILINPVELFAPTWKTGEILAESVEPKLLSYPYSSLQEFVGIERPQKVIVGNSLREYYDTTPSLASLLKTAQEYYLEHSPQV